MPMLPHVRCLALSFALLGTLTPVSAWAAGRFSWKTYANKPDDWFRGEEGKAVTANILSHQSDEGSWPKNQDSADSRFEGARNTLKGTFDNGASIGELRFLAHAARVTADSRSRAAFDKGLAVILKAQYPTGGWPQSYPPGKAYPRYITFNDSTMLNILEFLRDIAQGAGDFRIVDVTTRKAAGAAFDRGIACILKCQVETNGHLTVWCAQHDEVTLEPRPARKYELVSLSGAESAGLLSLLMDVDQPSPEVRRAVHAGARWFEAAKLTGIRQETVQGNKVIVEDPKASPLWARFYDIETNKPFFCGRDGVKKATLAEIESERRNGYSWYGNWGARVAREYAKWKMRWGGA